MNKKKFTKLLALYLPYLVIGLAATNLGEAWRLAEGKELGDKIMSLMGTIPVAFANPLPSLHPLDLLVGLCCGAGLRLAVYLKSKNAKKYRHGMEYGSARWGTPADIAPFMAPKFEDNIILTKTERLMMSNRPPDPKNARNKNVLVVGGSQGARVLNQTMPQVAAKLGATVTIWHQSGKGGQQTVQQAYAAAGQPQHKVTEFIDDMAAAYAWADVVVCRSGALTVSEIAAAGLPALFVPFQHKDRQQYWNALPLEKAGAAKIFEQPQFTADAVATTLAGWNRDVLLEMAQRARATAIPDATERVAKEVSLAAQA